MKIDQSKIVGYNDFLKTNIQEFDKVGGYETIVTGLIFHLPDTYGENTAKNLVYHLGSTPGETIAKKILADRKNELFPEPVEALMFFISRLKAYYQVQIDEIEKTEDFTKIKMRINWYMDSLFTKRPDIKRNDILCNINKGYFERAMTLLTGLKIKFEHLPSEKNECHVILHCS